MTLPFSCHGVEFSPFESERVAVATAQYFGFVGNGRLHVLGRRKHLLAGGGVHEIRRFDTQAGLFDCAWSECHPRQLTTAGADGAVKLWDLETFDDFPVASWKEHSQEVSGVEWNLVRKDIFASASWDGTVRLWSPGAATSLRVLYDHGQHPVYGAAWCPLSGCRLLSFSGDGTARVLDTNAPCVGIVLNAHAGQEVLSGDWDKYQSHVVATGCADGAVRTWDLRLPSGPVSISHEHRYAVRRLRFSPYATGVLATASYDMTVVLHDTSHNDCEVGSGRILSRRGPTTDGPTTILGLPQTGGGRVLGRCVGHTEFVAGVAFSLRDPRLLVTCAWDRRLIFWR